MSFPEQEKYSTVYKYSLYLSVIQKNGILVKQRKITYLEKGGDNT